MKRNPLSWTDEDQEEIDAGVARRKRLHGIDEEVAA